MDNPKTRFINKFCHNTLDRSHNFQFLKHFFCFIKNSYKLNINFHKYFPLKNIFDPLKPIHVYHIFCSSFSFYPFTPSSFFFSSMIKFWMRLNITWEQRFTLKYCRSRHLHHEKSSRHSRVGRWCIICMGIDEICMNLSTKKIKSTKRWKREQKILI
jgi:hypothetical protein